MTETDLKVKDQFSWLTHVRIMTEEEKNNIISTLKNPPQPPPPPPRDLIEGKKPLPPENKNQIDGDVMETDVNLFGSLSKYFNEDTLYHIIVFGSILFCIKMIEINWNTIKVFCIENKNYFYLVWSLFIVVFINRVDRNIYKPKREERKRINKWLKENL